jgi:hypothetical protein
MDTIFWFMFLVRPRPANPFYFHTPAAFVASWVAYPEMEIARQMTRNAIEDRSWQIEILEKWEIVSRQTYRGSPKSLEHLEKALLFGQCLVFYLQPEEEINEKKAA